MNKSFILLSVFLISTSMMRPEGLNAAESVSAAQNRPWIYEHFIDAVNKSHRKFKIDRRTFSDIQIRKNRALTDIKTYLDEKFGKADPNVLSAFAEIPREYFHYNYELKSDFSAEAYEKMAKPWAIGYGSALSDYLGQAYMTQLSQPKPDDVVLEIGTGSGFQIALFSRIVRKAFSIEIIEPLGRSVEKIFAPLHYDNVSTRVGDGYYGWPEVKGGFDIIMVTCSAQFVPPPLFKQLKPKGRLIIPIGQPFKRGQAIYVYTKDEKGRVRSRKDMGVYFIAMTGELMKQAQLRGGKTP